MANWSTSAAVTRPATRPVRTRSWFLEANFSGDKKTSFLGVTVGGGRRLTARVDIPRAAIEAVPGVSVERIPRHLERYDMVLPRRGTGK
jgi:hypothetical protein